MSKTHKSIPYGDHCQVAHSNYVPESDATWKEVDWLKEIITNLNYPVLHYFIPPPPVLDT